MSKDGASRDTEDANASCGGEAMLEETVSLDSIRSMAEAMPELENNISKKLSDFQHNF